MNPASAELVVGTIVAGKYRVEALLGRGGMGAVYLATNEDLGRRVALKLLLPQLAHDETLLKRFRQEARTAAAIGHPGIVEMLDLGTTEGGAPFIVMEALEGETLGSRTTRERQLPVGDVLLIVGQALDALAAAHDAGVLHRDLKPDNLFLVSRPVPGTKLLDFGISKLAGADELELTNTGTVLGTVLFMAPEQARGARNAGPASDIYSIGAILFHALTGRPPFTGLTYNEVLEKVFTVPPPSVTTFRLDVPPALALLIDRMLAKDPAARPASARDALAELRTIAAQLSTFVPPADAVAATFVGNGATPPAGTPIAQMRTLESGPTADTRQGPVAPTAPVRKSVPAFGATRPDAAAHDAPTRPAVSAPTVPASTQLAPSRVLWFVGGGLVIVAGIAIAALALRHSDEPGTRDPRDAGALPVATTADAMPVAPVALAVDAAAAPVALRFVASVGVKWSGHGVTCADGERCEVTAPAGTHAVITASAAGFKIADVEVVFDVERKIDVKLEQIPRTTPPRDAGVVVQPAVPVDAPRQLEIDHTNPIKH